MSAMTDASMDVRPDKPPESPLRRARKAVRPSMTIERLAGVAGISERHLRRLETTGAVPTSVVRRALAAALEVRVDAIFPVDERVDAPTPQAITWPPPPNPHNQAVQAYRAAGDAIGAAELLGIHEETIRQRLNQAGCRPRPRGGSNADGIESLASWARKLGISITDAVAGAQRGRVPGAFIQQLDDEVLGCRWAVRRQEAA